MAEFDTLLPASDMPLMVFDPNRQLPVAVFVRIPVVPSTVSVTPIVLRAAGAPGQSGIAIPTADNPTTPRVRNSALCTTIIFFMSLSTRRQAELRRFP